MDKLRVADDDAGGEGAESRGDAELARGRDRRDDQHDDAGGEDLPAAEQGDLPEDPGNDDAGNEHERQDADDRDRDPHHDLRQRRRAWAGGERRNEQHQRNDRKVLKQRHAEEPPRERRAHLVAGRQDGQDDRRRAERDQDPGERGAPRVGAEREPDEDDGQHGQRHLERAGKQGLLPERLELVERRVQADEEEDERE